MDIVEKRRVREFTLLMLVSVMALIANLPERVLEMVSLERDVIMAVLGLVVLMAVFLYVRLFFFLLYALLAVGANLPEQWAAALNISQTPLLIALIVMVSASLLNYSTKTLPTGLEKAARKSNPEALQALVNAIERGNATHARAVLSLDFDLDIPSAQGLTPLMRAVQRGNKEIVDLLLKAGASDTLVGPEGSLAEIAAKAGHSELAAQLSVPKGDAAPAASEQARLG